MSRFVTTVLALIGAPSAVACAWIASSTTIFPWTQVNVDVGQELFQQRCATCHTTERNARLSLGPSLHRVGAEAAKRTPDLSAEQYLLQSMIEPAAFRPPTTQGVMPDDIVAGLSSNEIVSLVGYLMTLGGELQPSRLAKMVGSTVPPQVDVDQAIDFVRAEHGRHIYLTKGKCSVCHPLQDVPGSNLLGPSLLHAGRHSATYLRQSLVQPHTNISDGYATAVVELVTGEVVTGRVISETQDGVELLLQKSDGLELRVLSKDEIETTEEGWLVEHSSKSAMPADYQSVLSSDEIDAVVYFLTTLK